MAVIRALFVYPVKSLGGIALDQAQLLAEGLKWDRNWMVVDETGQLVTQRQNAALARVVCAFVKGGVRLSTDGMASSLVLPFEPRGDERRVRATVWNDTVDAFDEGDEAAQWITKAVGVPLRIVRFAPDATRYANRKWTNDEDVPTHFADAFPLLVTNEASLADLNARLAAKGAPPVPMTRFRPNIVVDGEEAFDEDFVETMSIDGTDVVLRFAKPCDRCQVTTIDQLTGERDAQWPAEPLDTLMTFRADPRVNGGLTFGVNATVVSGAGEQVAVGAPAEWEWRFDE
ncbi:MOSC domain-containing protein [Paraburkholderia dinghuensis]|uniref:MOSC domain-containing protein n=1 Tax=Paraburkholderia dinghuensis TaxID=2305225 RepID=A0A3N6MPT8_9BURK|nr:MOSC N-terminal beta barrel domain-containing protein [Paraburkholderia dinghuensis]RQH05668.1 MOSC domain-containing protein [Paraburkholderia dinghuensis]